MTRDSRPLRLRPFAAGDIPVLQDAIGSRDELVRWAGTSGFTWPLTYAALGSYIDSARGSHTTLWSAVDDVDDVVGHAKLVDGRDGTVHVGHVLIVARARGRGLGGALVDALVRQARAGGARWVSLNVYADNAPARRAYERAGFVVQAVASDAYRDADGRSWDNLRMVLVLD